MIEIRQYLDGPDAPDPDALEIFSNNDLPETIATWRQLGLDAGFASADTLFTTHDRICAMFRYAKDQP